MVSFRSSTISLWESTESEGTPNFSALNQPLQADVAIVGAGITGLTAALSLLNKGLRVVVLEAGTVGGGVTAQNSGHLTTMLDSDYTAVARHFGDDSARRVAQALTDAIEWIGEQDRQWRLASEFQVVPGYLFAESAEQRGDLQSEYQAMKRLGLSVSRHKAVPLPFSVADGVVMERQARLHPLRYAMGLAHVLANHNLEIFEETRVTSVERESGQFWLQLENGHRVTARTVVLATHTPIGLKPLLQAKIVPYRSYIIGVRVRNHIPDALYWDVAEPYHYIRLAHDDAGDLLMIGGEDHKTGEEPDTRIRLNRLERYAQRRFDVRTIDYRWSAQLYDPIDGLPYIGELSRERGLYIATGFSGDGLTFGTIAGRLLADQILGAADPALSKLFSPGRINALASGGRLLTENTKIISHFIGDRLGAGNTPQSLEHIAPGEGCLMEVEGQKRAVYRAPDGQLSVLSPVCTHANCLVKWNTAENSWDCPCHGGRYTPTGEVLNGPPVLGLYRFYPAEQPGLEAAVAETPEEAVLPVTSEDEGS
jgi:glycine/D-amino acid oxidase-like deaminating enzyme/nitrite reductase/ring-hydroxylating ferredoxin subunit